MPGVVCQLQKGEKLSVIFKPRVSPSAQQMTFINLLFSHLVLAHKESFVNTRVATCARAVEHQVRHSTVPGLGAQCQKSSPPPQLSYNRNYIRTHLTQKSYLTEYIFFKRNVERSCNVFFQPEKDEVYFSSQAPRAVKDPNNAKTAFKKTQHQTLRCPSRG